MTGPVRVKEPRKSAWLVEKLVGFGLLTRPKRGNERLAPGDTRITLVAAHFSLLTFFAGLLSVVMTIALFTAEGRTSITPRGHPFFATGMAYLYTIGFAHTARLIRERSRTGAFLGIGLFATDLIWALVSGSARPTSLAISAVGLAALGSVWSRLEKDED